MQTGWSPGKRTKTGIARAKDPRPYKPKRFADIVQVRKASQANRSRKRIGIGQGLREEHAAARRLESLLQRPLRTKSSSDVQDLQCVKHLMYTRIQSVQYISSTIFRGLGARFWSDHGESVAPACGGLLYVCRRSCSFELFLGTSW